jgi:hypothetical protein
MRFSHTFLFLPIALLAIGIAHADPVIFIKNDSKRDVLIAPFGRKGDWLTNAQFIKPNGEYKDENLDANDIKGVHIKYCPQSVSCSSMEAVRKNGGSAVEFEFHDPKATKFYLKLDIDKKDNVTLKRQEGRLGRTSNLKWSLEGNVIQNAIIRTIVPAAPTDVPTPPSLGMANELMRIIAQENVYITTLQDMINGTMPLDESLLKESGFQEIIDKPMTEFRKKYGTNQTFNDREKDLIDTHTANYQKASNLLAEARKLAQKQKIGMPPTDVASAPSKPKFSAPPTDMPPALPESVFSLINKSNYYITFELTKKRGGVRSATVFPGSTTILAEIEGPLSGFRVIYSRTGMDSDVDQARKNGDMAEFTFNAPNARKYFFTLDIDKNKNILLTTQKDEDIRTEMYGDLGDNIKQNEISKIY